MAELFGFEFKRKGVKQEEDIGSFAPVIDDEGSVVVAEPWPNRVVRRLKTANFKSTLFPLPPLDLFRRGALLHRRRERRGALRRSLRKFGSRQRANAVVTLDEP